MSQEVEFLIVPPVRCLGLQQPAATLWCFLVEDLFDFSHSSAFALYILANANS